jgi:hypothetical protein
MEKQTGETVQEQPGNRPTALNVSVVDSIRVSQCSNNVKLSVKGVSTIDINGKVSLPKARNFV